MKKINVKKWTIFTFISGAIVVGYLQSPEFHTFISTLGPNQIIDCYHRKALERRAKDLFYKITGKQKNARIDETQWVDLIGNGDSSVLIIEYTQGDSIGVAAIKSLSDGNGSLLFEKSDDRLGTLFIGAQKVRISNKNYLLVDESGGNAPYYSFEIYSYDGIGFPALMFRDALPGGYLDTLNSRCIVRGRAGQYEVIEDHGRLIRRESEPISYKSTGESTNILTLRKRNGIVTILYNDTVLRMVRREYTENEKPIQLDLGSRFVWNPDVPHSEQYDVRDFTPNGHKLEILFENLHRVYRAIVPGLDTMMVDAGVRPWLNLIFQINGRDTLPPIGEVGKAWEEEKKHLRR